MPTRKEESMKRSSKLIAQQFNLSLLSAAPIMISQDKQKELKLVLMELLTDAVCSSQNEREHRGGDDESQTNR
jgi:hypothetical protein